MRLLLPLTVRLGGIVTIVHDQIFGSVIESARKVRVEDSLGASGVALLGIERGTRHVWDGGVPASPVDVRSVAQRVVLGCGLREPHITTVAAELTALERLCNVLLDDDSTTSGVDEPSA